MNRRLIVAVGGGGDVLTATSIARGGRDYVASFVWEKLSADPHPGPRRPRELLNVNFDVADLATALPNTSLPGGRLINQATLASAFSDVPQFILNAEGGSPSVAIQLQAICDLYGIDEVWGVDVGGDALSGIPTPTLTSPLVDAIFLGALSRLNLDASLIVFGLGLDGEVSERELKDISARILRSGFVSDIHTIPNAAVTKITRFIAEGAFSSEVSSLLFWSYRGLSGKVLFRDGGLRVHVGRESMLGYRLSVATVCREFNPLGEVVAEISSLKDASDKLRSLGHRTELQDQIDILAGREYQPDILAGAQSLLEIVAQIPSDIDYVARRYLARRMGVRDAVAESQFSDCPMLLDVGYFPFLQLIRND